MSWEFFCLPLITPLYSPQPPYTTILTAMVNSSLIIHELHLHSAQQKKGHVCPPKINTSIEVGMMFQQAALYSPRRQQWQGGRCALKVTPAPCLRVLSCGCGVDVRNSRTLGGHENTWLAGTWANRKASHTHYYCFSDIKQLFSVPDVWKVEGSQALIESQSDSHSSESLPFHDAFPLNSQAVQANGDPSERPQRWAPDCITISICNYFTPHITVNS